MAIMTVKQWTVPLERALDVVGLQWLNDTHPEIAEAVSQAVTAGAEPVEIRRLVMGRTGRIELALRCEQAARALLEMAI